MTHKIKPFPTQDADFGATLICAVRYCLGRETYMPDLVTSWIKGHCGGELPKGTLEVMLRDVVEQGRGGPKAYGMDCDYRTWMAFKAWLEGELNDAGRI